MSGIPDGTYQRLRTTLLNCGPFEDNKQLRAIFVSAPLAPWHNSVPEANNSIERVEALINFLLDKQQSGTHTNALLLFLQALQASLDPVDLCYIRLAALIAEVSGQIVTNNISPGSIPQVSIPVIQTVRSKAFISYSHQDKKYLQELQVHLAHYIHQNHIDIWDDTRILPGSRWYEEIEQALQGTTVAILLISADFLASDFIINYELPPLLAASKQGSVSIIPVILRACLFNATELAQFRSINPASQPLASLSRARREAIWSNLAETVWQMMK